MPHRRDMRLHLLLDHWLDRRGGDGVPLRSAIDPSAIVSVLPNIWLCEFNAADERFRMRLAGEEINKLYGKNISSCYFEEIASPYQPRTVDQGKKIRFSDGLHAIRMILHWARWRPAA